MEKKINNKLKKHNEELKDELIRRLDSLTSIIGNNINISNTTIHNPLNELRNFIIHKDECYLDKSDFTKRERKKNSISLSEQCHAKRACGNQCTRRKKQGFDFCGTHIKGTPNGIVSNAHKNTSDKNQKIIEVRQEEIAGIIYYIDDLFNVYKPEHIQLNKKNPDVIAKWIQDGENKKLVQSS